jgi:MFS family permease
VADRIGAGRVLFAGAWLLVALGTFITPYMTTTAGLILAIGVLSAGGAGMAGPAVLMAATTRLVPPERRGLATGIVNAGGSFGQFVMAPIAIALMAGVGWASALQVMGVLVLLCLPAAFLCSRATPTPCRRSARRAEGWWARARPLAQALRNAQLPATGSGLFRLRISCGLPGHAPARRDCVVRPAPAVGGWSLAVIGLFNIVGSLAMGWAVGRWRMKSLLSLLYATRALAVRSSCWRPRPEPPWCWSLPPSWA